MGSEDPGSAPDCRAHGEAILRLEARVNAVEKDVRLGHQRLADSIDGLRSDIKGLTTSVGEFSLWKARLEGAAWGGKAVWAVVGGGAGVAVWKVVEHLLQGM